MDEMIISEAGEKELKVIRQQGAANNEMMGATVSSGTGCTGNVVLITPKSYIVSNIGDSRSVLCKGSKAVPLSFDHKPESAEEEKRIINAGGSITMGRVNGGLNLSRSFGDFDYKQNKQLNYEQQMITCHPDVKLFDRSNEDEFIIMGCDGIWERYVDDNQGMVSKLKPQVDSTKESPKIM